MTQVASPRFSFRGWNLWSWIKGNGKTIKEFLKVGIPAIVGWVATSSPELTFLATAAGKFILDCAEYYLSTQDEES